MDLANQTNGLATNPLLDCFVSGLKPDVKGDVVAQSPSSLIRTIALAHLFDEKYSSPHLIAKSKSTFVPTFMVTV